MSKPMIVIIWLGGLALLLAVAIDTIAVIGRHVGLPLTGSIELMQAVILVSGALSLVVATVDQSHARVRLLVDKLSGNWRDMADRLSSALTMLFYLALLAGSAWLAADLWNGSEQSEWLGVPWRLLRLIANICLLAASLVLLRRVFGKRS
ncbi:MAG TPA: TRAP transporter small permease subunit [Croceibacterium sp.]|nr:TRAP transporter small permease subunit [Croceibacterium sp.]